MGTWIELSAADGHKFAAYKAEPAGKPKGAIVIGPEIFGVNDHIKAVADGFAADGFVAIAPALFDRAQRNYDTGYSQPEIQAGIGVMSKVSIDDAMKDVAASIAHVSSAGKVGMVGYCWGGRLTWIAACRVPGLSAAVSYYGGGIADYKDEQPKCAVMLQFGEQDGNPSPEQARSVAAKHPEAIAHFYPAGHGFNCDHRGSYNADASKLARTRTVEFFTKNLA